MYKEFQDNSQEIVFETSKEYINILSGNEGISDEDIEQINKDIENTKTEPNSILKQGIDMAKKEVNLLIIKLGLAVKPLSDMKVALLPYDKYIKIYNRITNTEETDSIAGAAGPLESILVSDQTYPNYLKAGIVYHELIHKFVDKQSRAFAKIPQDKNTDPEMFTESRRSGLQVRNVSRVTENGEDIIYGEIVNELGNYMAQKLFIQKCLQQADFTEESANRRRLLNNKNVTYICLIFANL